MSFALAYDSGSNYNIVKGSKCMVPLHTTTNPLRRWKHKGTNYRCPSGCSTGGDSSATLYIPTMRNNGWTGASGAIVVMYATNTSHDSGSVHTTGYGKYGESKLACNVWDVSAQSWYSLGEFIFSRSCSGSAGTYSTAFNENKFDIGDEWNDKPIFEDHGYFTLDLDLDNYLWGIYAGGHSGTGIYFGYNHHQCFRSTKPITDITWKPSGTSMWTNRGVITTTELSAYVKATTAKCACHRNWYFAALRNGDTGDPFQVFYSKNSGGTWNAGIEISNSSPATIVYSYTGFNFQYDPNSDKTLIFVRPYPHFGGIGAAAYKNPGYGIYWTDCHRMSGGAGSASHPNFYPPTGGFFATDVDPVNVTNTAVKTNHCPCAYSGTTSPPIPDLGELKSFDRYDFTRYPSQIYLEPSTRKIFFVSNYLSGTTYNNKLRLNWKTLGTTNTYVSSTVWNGSTTSTINLEFCTSITAVSGNNHDKYLMVPVSISSSATTKRYTYSYFIISGPIWSSQSNWKLMKHCTVVSGSIRPYKIPNISNDGTFASAFYGYSTQAHNYTTGTGIVNGDSFKESFLNFWDNHIPQYYVDISGVNVIDSTSVNVVGKVRKGSGNVTLYYDIVDKGESLSSWSYSADCGTQYDNVNNGWFSKQITDLNYGKDYIYRFYISTLASWK